MSLAERREVSLTVEPGKVAEFRAATGLPRDEASVFAPPTFPAVLEHSGVTFASLLADQGVDLNRVLHGEELIAYPDGPLRVGDQLNGELRIVADERTHGSSGPLRLVTVRAELRRPDKSVAVTVDRVMVVLEDELS
jgi:hydroxyacyl-ACP dehydratase HTD2-like protein with hotdog domain